MKISFIPNQPSFGIVNKEQQTLKGYSETVQEM